MRAEIDIAILQSRRSLSPIFAIPLYFLFFKVGLVEKWLTIVVLSFVVIGFVSQLLVSSILARHQHHLAIKETPNIQYRLLTHSSTTCCITLKISMPREFKQVYPSSKEISLVLAVNIKEKYGNLVKYIACKERTQSLFTCFTNYFIVRETVYAIFLLIFFSIFYN